MNCVDRECYRSLLVRMDLPIKLMESLIVLTQSSFAIAIRSADSHERKRLKAAAEADLASSIDRVRSDRDIIAEIKILVDDRDMSRVSWIDYQMARILFSLREIQLTSALDRIRSVRYFMEFALDLRHGPTDAGSLADTARHGHELQWYVQNHQEVDGLYSNLVQSSGELEGLSEGHCQILAFKRNVAIPRHYAETALRRPNLEALSCRFIRDKDVEGSRMLHELRILSNRLFKHIQEKLCETAYDPVDGAIGFKTAFEPLTEQLGEFLRKMDDLLVSRAWNSDAGYSSPLQRWYSRNARTIHRFHAFLRHVSSQIEASLSLDKEFGCVAYYLTVKWLVECHWLADRMKFYEAEIFTDEESEIICSVGVIREMIHTAIDEIDYVADGFRSNSTRAKAVRLQACLEGLARTMAGVRRACRRKVLNQEDALLGTSPPPMKAPSAKNCHRPTDFVIASLTKLKSEGPSLSSWLMSLPPGGKLHLELERPNGEKIRSPQVPFPFHPNPSSPPILKSSSTRSTDLQSLLRESGESWRETKERIRNELAAGSMSVREMEDLPRRRFGRPPNYVTGYLIFVLLVLVNALLGLYP